MGHHLHSKVRIPSKGALCTKASYSKIQWLWVTILQSELGRGIVSASAELMFGRGPPLSSVLTGTLAGMRDNLPHTTQLIYYLSLKNVAVKKKLCHFNWWSPCQKILRLLEQGGLEFKHSFLTHFALIRLIQKIFLKDSDSNGARTIQAHAIKADKKMLFFPSGIGSQVTIKC